MARGEVAVIKLRRARGVAVASTGEEEEEEEPTKGGSSGPGASQFLAAAQARANSNRHRRSFTKQKINGRAAHTTRKKLPIPFWLSKQPQTPS